MDQRISEFQLKELFKNRKFDAVLTTVSGKRVEILRTGEVNSDTGPDFRDSLVRINGTTIRGDIELHRTSSDWYQHNHNHDRNYNSVVLHVVDVCDDSRVCVTEAGRRIETLELSNFLAADAFSFLENYESDEKIGALRCAPDCRKLPIESKLKYLGRMGEKRFMHRVNKLEERLQDIIDENRPVVFEAKQTYFRDFSNLRIEHKKYDESEWQTEKFWDQLLYEGIMEGLGYSKNTAAFRKLARNVSLDFLRENEIRDALSVESVLFGAANLLPATTDDFDDESVEYCRKLEDAWQKVRRKYRREYVDRSEWLFFKLRPQNFPTVRIAGAARLISECMMERSAAGLISESVGQNDRFFLEKWRKMLITSSRGFWRSHFIFGTPAGCDVRMLIGAGRAEEILVNTVLPVVFLRGRIFHDEAISRLSFGIFVNHPPVADNMITLVVKESLFDGDNVLSSVATQQGALHLYRTLCAERRCERCGIGKSVFGKTAA